MSENEIISRFKRGDRQALAKLITLVESDAQHSRGQVAESLSALPKPKPETLRIALSGPPGVGKSTVINILGQKIVKAGFKLAILPIDPASELSGGSILADKTRMTQLVNNPDVFIRPSSSRGVMGGVNLAMSDVIFTVEAFGYNCIIIETVGVGQAEVLAYSLADFFVVLTQPGSGDALQAMKKGILERADFVVVNKADGNLLALATKSYNQLSHDLHQEVFKISALEDSGIDDLLARLIQAHEARISSQELLPERARRLEGFFSFALQERLWPKLMALTSISERRRLILDKTSKDQQALGPQLDVLAQEILARFNTK